jgi:hypothetical protein
MLSTPTNPRSTKDLLKIGQFHLIACRQETSKHIRDTQQMKQKGLAQQTEREKKQMMKMNNGTEKREQKQKDDLQCGLLLTSANTTSAGSTSPPFLCVSIYPSLPKFLSNANINNQSLYGVWSFDLRYGE